MEVQIVQLFGFSGIANLVIRNHKLKVILKHQSLGHKSHWKSLLKIFHF